MSGRPSLVALAALLAAAPARAADVVTLAWTQNSAASALTLRLPRTGSFTMAKVDAGYLAAAVAMSDAGYDVTSVTWTSTLSGAGPPQQFHKAVAREHDVAPACRSAIWVVANPVSGPGFATVIIAATSGSPPVPALAAALFSFGNVGATWTDGACCVNVANTGTGVDIINKTVGGTSRGDAWLNSVCTHWSGAALGTPTPDPDKDPEMVPRTFQTLPSADMQHFTGTSPGPLVDRPATSYRHLRWLQSGSRSWVIVGLGLLATTDPPDAGTPPWPDAAPPTADAAPPPAADAALAADSAPAPPDQAAGEDAGPRSPDAAAPAPLEPPAEPDADPGQRQISFQVGCACDVAARSPGGGALLLLALLLRRRRPRG
jgi:hypothetical protein